MMLTAEEVARINRQWAWASAIGIFVLLAVVALFGWWAYTGFRPHG